MTDDATESVPFRDMADAIRMLAMDAIETAMAALTELCARRFEDFGTAGQASHLRPGPLAAMAARYAKLELDPVSGGDTRQTLAA